MPYFSVGRASHTLPSISRRMPYNEISGETIITDGSYEVGFRTRMPSGDEVKEIALNVAEPYSWWVDYQQQKIASLGKTPGFDTSLLRQDRGHYWHFEQLKLRGLQDFTWGFPGSEWYEVRGGIPYFGSAGVGVPDLPDSSIETWAAQQYGRMAPVVGEFSLSTFLGELREGLPHLIPEFLTRAKVVKGAGSDYLNVEFGWKPLINDLQGLADSFLQASFGLFRPLGASHRRRDRPVIESFNRTDITAASNISVALGKHATLAGYNPGSTSKTWAATGAYGIGSLTRSSSVKQWVEGEFVYIPKAGFDPGNFLDRYETLASVDLTPAVLWELAPWSWLVDWAGQIGQSLSSMEAGLSNRILSTYFYGMEDAKATAVTDVTVLGNQSGRYHTGPKQMSTRIERRRRRRIRANPFGYGGSSSVALNGSQMAILGALGLTRLK